MSCRQIRSGSPVQLSVLERTIQQPLNTLDNQLYHSKHPASVLWCARLLSPLFHLLGDGCRPDVPIDEVIRASGMSIESLERSEGPLGPRTARQMYRGIARRRGRPPGA